MEGTNGGRGYLLAILLHMKDPTAYTFDRVAFVDMGGRGVRDLSSDATSIWVIAAPRKIKQSQSRLSFGVFGRRLWTKHG